MLPLFPRAPESVIIRRALSSGSWAIIAAEMLSVVRFQSSTTCS